MIAMHCLGPPCTAAIPPTTTRTPKQLTATPFSRTKTRTGALVFRGDEVALKHRDRADPTHCTPPDGNVEHRENLDGDLARKLQEEAGLNAEQAEQAEQAEGTELD
ncbi:NUDIX hydrolase [Streptomyces sp. NPDC056161]|uniref:NUDIX hydrolase n=1 Tax=Streptomyces sp. NPDC056161 TaxID=3345732 RepID=UPI0035DE06A0